ncbi:hypothetical protein ACFQ0B_60255 [Nonomuraea thailandensis]
MQRLSGRTRTRHQQPPPPGRRRHRRAGAAEQARLLLSYGARPITLDAARDLHTTPAHRAHFAQRLREALRTSAALAVLTISGQAPPTAAATLAELVGAALTGHTPPPTWS